MKKFIIKLMRNYTLNMHFCSFTMLLFKDLVNSNFKKCCASVFVFDKSTL